MSRQKRGRLDRFLESEGLLEKGQLSMNLTVGEPIQVSSNTSSLKNERS
jgi:hypothetical protein